MARHSRSRRHHKRRSMRGGYSSASTYGTYVNGSVDSQYNRVFGSGSANQSNVIVGEQGQWARPVNTPTAQNLALVQSAGRRRHRRRHGRSRRGGLIGEVVNQAIVPLTLLGMQHTYRKGKRGGRRTRRRSHRRH